MTRGDPPPSRRARQCHTHSLTYNRVAQTYTDTYLFAANSGAHVPLILLFPVALVGLFQVACIPLQVSTCDECNNVTEMLCNHQRNEMRIKHSSEIPFDDLKSLFFSQAASCKCNKKFSNTRTQAQNNSSPHSTITLQFTNIPQT